MHFRIVKNTYSYESRSTMSFFRLGWKNCLKSKNVSFRRILKNETFLFEKNIFLKLKLGKKFWRTWKLNATSGFGLNKLFQSTMKTFPPLFDSAIEPLLFIPPILSFPYFYSKLNFAFPLLQSSHKADLKYFLMFSVTHSHAPIFFTPFRHVKLPVHCSESVPCNCIE